MNGWVTTIKNLLLLGIILPALWACTPAPPPPAKIDGVLHSSRAIQTSNYFKRLEEKQISRGLLRTDGGGVDTPYSRDIILRNFQDIAFRDEYAQNGGAFTPATAAQNKGVKLRKWQKPIRVAAHFGAQVSPRKQQEFERELTQYLARLRKITGHSIALTNKPNSNFHVFYVGVDDADYLGTQLQKLAPSLPPQTIKLVENLPIEIRCLVMGFSDDTPTSGYKRAIAVVRAEHPPLLRNACIHEEIAQGLGLVNDSPYARPSIFNDDDEFALLTSHDELLLKLLYDPRLRAGMTFDEAMPILRARIKQLMPE